MKDNFSPKVKDVIAYSKEAALDNADKNIGTEHLLKGLLRIQSKELSLIFDSLNIDSKELKEKLEEKFFANPHLKMAIDSKGLRLTKQAEKALKTTFLEAKLHNDNSVNATHLLMCILRSEIDPTTKFLKVNGLTYDLVKGIYVDHLGTTDKSESPGELKTTETSPVLKVTDPEIEDTEPPAKMTVESATLVSPPDAPRNFTTTESTFEEQSSSISLYFLEDEYSPDDIAEVLSVLSDLYREEGGEGLIIKGHDILECDSVLEPVCI